jgi:hypothetical protein
MARTRSALVLLCLLPACASPTNSSVSRTYPADQMAQMRDLKREQARFDAAKALPQKLEFAGQGQITITQLSLDGFPDNVYVRARWHYQNNTGKPVVRAIVSLDVLDADSKVVSSTNAHCIFPTIQPIYEGTFYSDELRTNTHGAHLHPGWSWRMTCKAEYQDEEALENDRRYEAGEAPLIGGQRGHQ